jgi:hypothetical protein
LELKGTLFVSGTQGLVQRTAGFVITWGGIVFIGVIVGFVYDAIQTKMDELRSGRSSVVEEGHTLMLGWTAFSISFILEICDANSSEGGGVLVVMSDHDKSECEREFYSCVQKKHLMGTDVVFRTGSALSLKDLAKVSASSAKSILILATSGHDADKQDAITLRTVLTLKGIAGLQGHIVAELRAMDNQRMVELVGGEILETVVSHDIIGRLLLMSARIPGLSAVYAEMLGFAGDEFYIESWPQLTGMSFGEICTCMPMCIPVGVKVPNEADPKGFSVLLIPDMDRKMGPDDQLVVLAEDDDTYSIEADCYSQLEVGKVPPMKEDRKTVENILIVGWRRDIRDMFQLLDSMVKQGTRVHLLSSVPLEDRDELLLDSGFDPESLQNFLLVHHEGNAVARMRLEQLPVETYTSVIILSDQMLGLGIMQSDSQTLATLLLLRDIQQRRELEFKKLVHGGAKAESPHPVSPSRRVSAKYDPIFLKCPISCEILDTRTSKTIAANKFVANVSEFVQTNQLFSQALAMIAEEPAVEKILSELLGSTGCDLSSRESTRYMRRGERLSFMVVAKRAQLFNEIVLGYQDREESTFMNPPDKMTKRTWDDFDFVIMSRGADLQVKQEAGPRPPKVVLPTPDRGVPGAVHACFSERYTALDRQLDMVGETVQHMTHMAQCYMSEQARKGEIMSFIADQKHKQALLYI